MKFGTGPPAFVKFDRFLNVCETSSPLGSRERCLVHMARTSTLWCCYLLSFRTARGEERRYYGATELRGQSSAQQACEVRKQYHATHPLKWVRNAVAYSLQIKPLDVLTELNALAQEALLTAQALEGSEDSVRGACWSGPYMSAAWRDSAAAVRETTWGLSGQRARQALLSYAHTLAEEHPLRRHLAGEPFSGAKQPARTLPKLGRKTLSASGHQKRMRLREKSRIFKGSAKEKRLHRGIDPEQRRAAENEKRQPLRRKTPQTSTRKRQLHPPTLGLLLFCIVFAKPLNFRFGICSCALNAYFT